MIEERVQHVDNFLFRNCVVCSGVVNCPIPSELEIRMFLAGLVEM